MWRRLTELLVRIGILSRDLPVEDDFIDDGPDDPEIQFRSLNPPQTLAMDDDALVCPVTRAALHQGKPLYLCRNCNTAYSVEGWTFLRETDQGRCCHCRQVGTVAPFRAGQAM